MAWRNGYWVHVGDEEAEPRCACGDRCINCRCCLVHPTKECITRDEDGAYLEYEEHVWWRFVHEDEGA